MIFKNGTIAELLASFDGEFPVPYSLSREMSKA